MPVRIPPCSREREEDNLCRSAPHCGASPAPADRDARRASCLQRTGEHAALAAAGELGQSITVPHEYSASPTAGIPAPPTHCTASPTHRAASRTRCTASRTHRAAHPAHEPNEPERRAKAQVLDRRPRRSLVGGRPIGLAPAPALGRCAGGEGRARRALIATRSAHHRRRLWRRPLRPPAADAQPTDAQPDGAAGVGLGCGMDLHTQPRQRGRGATGGGGTRTADGRVASFTGLGQRDHAKSTEGPAGPPHQAEPRFGRGSAVGGDAAEQHRSPVDDQAAGGAPPLADGRPSPQPKRSEALGRLLRPLLRGARHVQLEEERMRALRLRRA